MGMPIIVEILGTNSSSLFKKVFGYFESVDDKFSTYKPSEVSLINSHQLSLRDASREMQEIWALSEKTKKETNGFFDISHQGQIDPSGIVKGWAVLRTSQIIKQAGFMDYYINAGGDIQAGGHNGSGKSWQIGIKNPFKDTEIIKILHLTNLGVATSGSYIRGAHIYRPTHLKSQFPLGDVISLTVIGPNVFEADRFATAAFAMGRAGIWYIEKLPNFEGYLIDKHGLATETSGFAKYTKN